MHTQTGSETRKETPYVARERIINMSCFSENPFLSQQALVLPGVPREDLNLAIRLFTHHRPVLPLTFASCRALGLDVAFFRRANSAQLSSHCRSSLLCLCCYAEHCCLTLLAQLLWQILSSSFSSFHSSSWSLSSSSILQCLFVRYAFASS